MVEIYKCNRCGEHWASRPEDVKWCLKCLSGNIERIEFEWEIELRRIC